MENKNYFRPGLLLSFLLSYVAVVQALPDIQTWRTENGVKVLFVESPSLPMLDLRVVFDAGSVRDGKLSGLASLTNGLLVEGADGLDAQEIAERFESVGAVISVASLQDMALVGLRSLTDERYLNVAIDTLKKVLTRPDFTSRAFDRDLARMKVALQLSKQSPAAIARKAFYGAIYGEHPYATPTGGTDESLASIKRVDVLRFYEDYYVAENARIIIVGAVNLKKAKQIANSVVSGLRSGNKPVAIPVVQPLEEAETIYIEFPSQQSHIFVGQPGMKRGDVDYFTLYVANHPFGGSGFASRLLEKIRGEHGLVYSVYSYFSPMRENGPFTMGMQTRADQTDQALSLLRKELDEYITNGPTKEELKSSISNIVGSYPLNLDSNSKLLSYLGMISFYDLPMSYLQDFVSNIESVTLNDIKKTIKRRIQVDKMVTVIVGKVS